jgi:hypothetical protein
MVSKSTIAVSREVRNRLKKLAELLNKSQGDIVQLALNDFEKQHFKDLKQDPHSESNIELVDKILAEATKEVWESDPEHKELQLKLKTSGSQIDDYLIRTWDFQEN